MKRINLLFILLMLLVSVLPVVAQNDATIATTIEEFAADEDNPKFTILVQLLEETELLETLADEDVEFTIFAPTDDAFEELLEEFELTLEDLLDSPDILIEILLYHAVDGIIMIEDMEDGDEIETLQGNSIMVMINDADEVILDEFSVITNPDLEVSNGVIHVIDRVLLPPDEGTENGDSASEEGGGVCLVSTDQTRYTRVRVGPGENRTSVTFLEPNVDYTVLGRFEDDGGEIWYQLDKEEAAPGRAINEAWVAAGEVSEEGDCENIGESAPPPLIPIISQPPPQAPSNDGDSDSASDDGSQDDAGVDTSGQIQLAGGTWTETLSPTVNASCEGTGNVSFPVTELYSRTSYNYTLTNTSSGFVLGGTVFTYIGNNTYQAVESVGSYTGTSYATVVSANRMEVRFIFSFSSGGTNCSATVTSIISR